MKTYTNWTSVKPILREGLVLSTLGVLLTAVSLGTFVWFGSNASMTGQTISST